MHSGVREGHGSPAVSLLGLASPPNAASMPPAPCTRRLSRGANPDMVSDPPRQGLHVLQSDFHVPQLFARCLEILPSRLPCQRHSTPLLARRLH
jgi:hypothetical protein